MEAMSRDRATFVAACEWTQVYPPSSIAVHSHPAQAAEGGFNELLSPKTVPQKWRTGPSYLHNSCSQTEKTASNNP